MRILLFIIVFACCSSAANKKYRIYKSNLEFLKQLTYCKCSEHSMEILVKEIVLKWRKAKR
jgi:hypothetical protein